MSGQMGGQPIIILRQGTQETRGEEAKRSNIMAARAVQKLYAQRLVQGDWIR